MHVENRLVDDSRVALCDARLLLSLSRFKTCAARVVAISRVLGLLLAYTLLACKKHLHTRGAEVITCWRLGSLQDAGSRF